MIKVDVGIMSHLSQFLNFSKENNWNEVKIMFQHNEDMAIPKIKLVLGIPL